MMARTTEGFTLLEVLIAMSIFAISVSIVYGLYATMMSVVQNVEDRTSLNDQVRTAFVRFNKDLSGLYRGEQGFLDGRDSVDLTDDEPILELVSSAHLSFDAATDPVPLSVIRYYLVPEEQDDTYTLLRSDTPEYFRGSEEGSVPQEGRAFRLCMGLAEVRIRYLDRNGDDNSVWDTREMEDAEQKEDSRFPISVRIELVFPTDRNGEVEGTVYSTAVLLRPGLLSFGGGSGG